jgi:hypothetical protein
LLDPHILILQPHTDINICEQQAPTQHLTAAVSKQAVGMAAEGHTFAYASLRETLLQFVFAAEAPTCDGVTEVAVGAWQGIQFG